MKVRILFLLLLCFSAFSVTAQQLELFERAEFVQQEDTLRYRILYPRDFSDAKEYPLVFVLHGAGERGRDNAAQLTHGASLFLKDEARKDFPAIVIFPQVEPKDYWAQVDVQRDSASTEFKFRNTAAPTKAMRLLMSFSEEMASRNFVDTTRIYIGGLSMGGMGTFEILYRKPDFFAAAFAICGGADPAIVKAYPKGFNIWIFHGEQDRLVPVEFGKTMAREINSHGANAKLSLYPDASHNSWDSAFAEPYLLPWLFSHSKEDNNVVLGQ